MPATNIEQIVREFDALISAAIEARDETAYFACLYRQVTLAVRNRINDGTFTDNLRMEQLVVSLANRYLTALAAFREGNKPSRSWCAAFAAAGRRDVSILQHLLLGINAHINFDLGISVAEVYPARALPDVRADFDRINTILAILMNSVEGVVERFSPLLGILDRLGGPADEALINFSIRAARDDAWTHAEMLAAQSEAQRAATIDLMDTKAAFLARLIAEPGRIVGKALELIRMRESEDVPAIAMALNTIVAMEPGQLPTPATAP